MDRTRTVGVALSVAGVAGYLVGLWTPYPGRAFAVTAAMVGLTLLALGGVAVPETETETETEGST